MLITRFAHGPRTPTAPMLVSVTDYTSQRATDLPGILRAGIRLRRGWPQLDGAIGVWLWTELPGRSGSVSVWVDEAALHGFVKWAPHVEIMRRYGRRGTLRSTSWWEDDFDPSRIWRTARQFLAGEPTG